MFWVRKITIAQKKHGGTIAGSAGSDDTFFFRVEYLRNVESEGGGYARVGEPQPALCRFF